MKKIKFILSFLFIALIVLLIFYHFHTSTPSKTNIAAVTNVTVMKLDYQILPEFVFAYGNIVSSSSVRLKAQTSGILTSLRFTPGQTVHRGDVIFTLKSNDTDTQFEKLAAQMQSSKQQYFRSKRAEKLIPGMIAQNRLKQEELQYKQDLASYNEAKEIHSARAPVSGIITETPFAVGDFVTVGDKLATIVNSKQLQITYEIPSRYADQIKLGLSIHFTCQNKNYTGKISYISPQLDSESGGLTVRADFIPPIDLLINDSCTVKQLINADTKILAVPQNLVQTDTQGFYVYLLKYGKVTKQYFVPGDLTKEGLFKVDQGLQLGDLVITTDPKTLSPNQFVKAENR